MSEEDELLLGTIAGVDLILSPEHYKKYKGNLNRQIDEKDKEIERLNNIIKASAYWVDGTIEVIEQQPTGHDGWILGRLNGIKKVLSKGSDKE